jgi:hypothetical protein
MLPYRREGCELDDPFEQFIGAFSSTVPDWADRHDEYIRRMMVPEYEFSGKQGVRGKYHRAYQQGHTVRIQEEDGTVTTQYFPLEEGAVLSMEVAMNGLTLSNVLSSVQFVQAPTGRRLAVMDADDWIGLVEWLEEVEDRQVIRANLERLRAGPEDSGAVPLETILDEL